MKNIKLFITCLIMMGSMVALNAQSYWSKIEEKESTLGVADVYQKHSTKDFELKLVRASQTVAGLRPKSDLKFDFTPGDRIEIRDKDGLYHLGDINLRLKAGKGEWKTYSTAAKRKAVTPLEVSGDILAGADLANTLPSDIPVQVKRYYETKNDQLVLRFEITNTSKSKVEIGALGIPMCFNNILEGKSLEQTHAQNVFFDPYIGMDAGYLEVKRLNGQGPAMLVLPEENMPFEAYRPLNDDPSPRSVVFEGFHEWMSHSKAYAETDWKGVQQWNTPTSSTLKPGESKSYAIRLVLTESIEGIQTTLIEEDQPVAIGIPGYVLPKDVNGQLFINYKHKISKIDISPKGALEIKEDGMTTNGLKRFAVNGKIWGRSLVTITYDDGKVQTINYKVIKAESDVVKDFGHFLTTEQWFDDKDDPFGRGPSVITYDYEKKEQVKQDSRAWICGLSDEGGAGGWLAAIMKQLIQPDKAQISKLQMFIDSTLWGGIQFNEGQNKYGVRKSVFYYEPDDMPEGTYSKDINFNTWAAWDLKHSKDPGRSYNYPHVAAAHWVMYRLGRYHRGLVNNHPWDWYLKNAYHTSVAMVEQAPYYAQFGQMEGSVFLLILKDLQNEGLNEMADDLEARMKKRADHWRSLAYPFGSEMPWDCTGQEEVYMWSDYFGYDYKALVTLNAIKAYMPTIPHWAYNGNARRYWDFLYGGKAGPTSRVERQIHHYGSSLNAIPVLSHYRKYPEQFYLLRIGYGGVLGGISNITEDGFGPAAFHSYPSTLKNDGISGDYGSGFFGYATNSSTYVTYNEELGWVAFGGNLTEKGNTIEVDITTAAKSRIFVAPAGLWITLDAGTFSKVILDKTTGAVHAVLNPETTHAPMAYLRLNQDIDLPYTKTRGAYLVPLDKVEKKIRIR